MDSVKGRPNVDMDQSKPETNRLGQREWAVAALFPVLIVSFLFFAAPHFLDPMFHKAPTVLGLPIGTVIVSLSAGWYAVGVTLIAMTSKRLLRFLAMMLFLIPATLAFIFGPAMVLILENLTAQM